MEYGMMIAVKAMRVQSSLGTAGRAVQAGVRGLVMLFVLACCVLRAEEALQTPTPKSAADLKSSASAPVPLNWTSSDLIALGLIVLGATVVFIPVPKFRSGKAEKKPAEAPVREVCRTAPHGGRSSLGADRTPAKQASTI
jgi:hypothetical protein